MKGPGERLKYDFRRVWECPVCRHRERTGGDVTFRLCACQRKVDPSHRVWMKLIQEGGRRAETPQPESAPPPQITEQVEPPEADPAATDAPDLTQPIE
jgi:hypothetical protein